ncbi:hypothetical protein CAP40_06755 [Sphingomonas sp. IBVSS2]|nr:hypothetical protein CAP40_06755 [Sphingomonas sp. IBVSS2]
MSHLMAAAGNHLNRVDKLADTEWKVTLAFWAAMLASGASLIGVAGGSKPQIAYLIYSNSAAILAIYLAGVSIFIFGFSSNQSQSISTERNRFLTYQAAALKAAGVADSLIIPVDPPMGAHSPLARVPRAQTRRSPVWAMKLAASTSFVLTITGTAVVLAGVRATEWPSTVTMGSLWAALNFVAAGCIGFLWLELVARFLARARASRQ